MSNRYTVFSESGVHGTFEFSGKDYHAAKSDAFNLMLELTDRRPDERVTITVTTTEHVYTWEPQS